MAGAVDHRRFAKLVRLLPFNDSVLEIIAEYEVARSVLVPDALWSTVIDELQFTAIRSGRLYKVTDRIAECVGKISDKYANRPETASQLVSHLRKLGLSDLFDVVCVAEHAPKVMFDTLLTFKEYLAKLKLHVHVCDELARHAPSLVEHERYATRAACIRALRYDDDFVAHATDS